MAAADGAATPMRQPCCPSVAISGWLTLCILHGSFSIKIIDVRMPKYIVKGSEVILHCKYDPEGSEIYAVKWYKDKQEFYYFLPQSAEPKGVYTVAGFDVTLAKSTDSEVALRNIGDRAAGTYMCEISGEGPNFSTVIRRKNVSVAALPETRPHIWGDLRSYRPGQNITVNCTSSDSRPPARISWFINGEQVSRDSIERWLTPAADGLTSVTSVLRLTVRRHHFKAGVMKLQCTATLGDVYWESSTVRLTLWQSGRRGASSGVPPQSGCRQKLPVVALFLLLARLPVRLG